MRSTDERFYKTREWKDCRESYAKSKRYLCENCLDKGRHTTGVIVHHIVPLDRVNVYNPEIALSFGNLRLLCQKCHNEIHNKNRQGIRYEIDERTGEVSYPHDLAEN